jgi:hypothetical protein
MFSGFAPKADSDVRINEFTHDPADLAAVVKTHSGDQFLSARHRPARSFAASGRNASSAGSNPPSIMIASARTHG